MDKLGVCRCGEPKSLCKCKSMDKATERPWKLCKNKDGQYWIEAGENAITGPLQDVMTKTVVLQAVKAVNRDHLFDKLVEAVRVLAQFGLSNDFGYMEDGVGQRITKEDCERARAVLKEVEQADG